MILPTSDVTKVTTKTQKTAIDDKIFSPGSTSQENKPPAKSEKPSENPPSEGTTYILNTNTMKFHYPSCSSADSISENNRAEYTGTRDELIDKGYSPCSRCHPYNLYDTEKQPSRFLGGCFRYLFLYVLKNNYVRCLDESFYNRCNYFPDRSPKIYSQGCYY